MARGRQLRYHPARPNRGPSHAGGGHGPAMFAQLTAQGGGVHPISSTPTAAPGVFDPGGRFGGLGSAYAGPHPTPFYTGGLAAGSLAGAPGAVVSNVGSGIISGIAPYLKIAVGALGLMVAGVTIVFVAGRKTGVGGAVGGAVGAVAGGPAGAVVGKAVGGATRAPRERRSALKSEVGATRRRVASEEARSRVETRSTPSGSSRVRTVSRREGASRRSADAASEEERRSHTREQNRANLAALKSRRSSSGSRSKVSA